MGKRRACTDVHLYQPWKASSTDINANKRTFGEKGSRQLNGCFFHFFLSESHYSSQVEQGSACFTSTESMPSCFTPVVTMDSSTQALMARGLLSLMMPKCRGADGSKTPLEDMKYVNW